jgi:hypothetical protein
MMGALSRLNPQVVHAEKIELWSDGVMVGRAGIVVTGDDYPDVVMLDGHPFIRDPAFCCPTRGLHGYRRVRPYCISTTEA